MELYNKKIQMHTFRLQFSIYNENEFGRIITGI